MACADSQQHVTHSERSSKSLESRNEVCSSQRPREGCTSNSTARGRCLLHRTSASASKDLRDDDPVDLRVKTRAEADEKHSCSPRQRHLGLEIQMSKSETVFWKPSRFQLLRPAFISSSADGHRGTEETEAQLRRKIDSVYRSLTVVSEDAIA